MLRGLNERNTHYTVINSGLDSHAIRYQDKLIATVSSINHANSSLGLTDQQKDYYAFMIHAYDGPAHGKTFFAANEDEVASQIELLTHLNVSFAVSEALDHNAVISWVNKEESSHTVTVLGVDPNNRHVFWMNSDSPSALCCIHEYDFIEVFRPVYPEVKAGHEDPLGNPGNAQVEVDKPSL